MIQVKQFIVNHFGVNCFVLWDESTKQCALIDPAAEMAHDVEPIDRFVAEHDLRPELILLTHPHVDHACGLRHFCERYHLPVTMHKEGEGILSQIGSYASVMRFEVRDLRDLERQYVDDGDVLKLGDNEIEVRFVPGHCPGSVCFVLHDEKMVFTGDTLFRMSIGRTDLAGGDYDRLMERLRSRILVLDDDYQVLPGHGDLTSIGEEHLYNGFLQEQD